MTTQRLAGAGNPYSPLDCNVDEHGVCRLTGTYHSALQMRIAFLTIQQFSMALTTVQGIQDMHHLPYDIGRYPSSLQLCVADRL